MKKKTMREIEIEFIRDYKTCHKKGARWNAQPHFAEMLIELGYAKAIHKPNRHKMMEGPTKAKSRMSVEV